MVNKSAFSPKYTQIEHGYGLRFQGFQNLMRFRVRDILLVSSLYDSYILEEDGRLYELIRNEYQGLNLSHSPELTRVNSGNEAMQLLREDNKYDIIITTLHIEDMSPKRFAQQIKKNYPDIPVILLAFNNRDLGDFIYNVPKTEFDNVFVWQGDFRIIISIIKYIEDKNNVENDTATAGVECIIVIEDNPIYYSSFLPNIYTELMKQSLRLISEGINLSHKSLRMRARPKILLTNNYEEAMEFYQRYRNTVLGIITDQDFFRGGIHDSEAGIKFIQEVKSHTPDVPILLQSNNTELKQVARQLSVDFVLKYTPRLLDKLRKFMVLNFSFGNFIFKMPDGSVVGEAEDLLGFERAIAEIPAESIIYHAMRNDFSSWLKARTEFEIAHQLKPKKVVDFADGDELRSYLLSSLRMFRKRRQQGIISDFNMELFDDKHSFSRLGGGSLGGKARGLGFINSLINNYNISARFPDIVVAVPSTLVIATDIFDLFLDQNELRDFAIQCDDDENIVQRFRDADLPPYIVNELSKFLEIVSYPLAIRSSSLLEDSQYHPFAGVYETLMIPNNHKQFETRLNELILSIKYVFASTFFQKAKNYLRSTAYRMEEEKMAVIIQKIIGSKHGDRFYPECSGVAQSFNFYPIRPLKSDDGIVSVALGLGKWVVEGGSAVKFCAKYPEKIAQNSNIKSTMDHSQHRFFALNMGHPGGTRKLDLEHMIQEYPISEAEKDNVLNCCGSTWSPENQIIYDGISRPGIRLITFMPILKHKIFPLPEIVQLITEMGAWGMGTPVEIEFAAKLKPDTDSPKTFAILQVRPIIQYHELDEININSVPDDKILCKSSMVLGNGIIENIRDIVMVDYNRFDRSKTRLIAREIAAVNHRLRSQNIPYLLIGLGRWGSADPWLGIPVTWDQISGARIIIEAGLKDIIVEPSQGSHFFQNISSFGVGYFSVNQLNEENFIDWDWLKAAESVLYDKYIRHIRLEPSLTVKMDGRHNKGLITKPGEFHDSEN